jgi:hypothetical protein
VPLITSTDRTVPVTAQTRTTLEPLPHRAFLLRRIVAPLWKQYMHAGVEGAARAAERIRRTEVRS